MCWFQKIVHMEESVKYPCPQCEYAVALIWHCTFTFRTGVKNIKHMTTTNHSNGSWPERLSNKHKPDKMVCCPFSILMTALRVKESN